MPPSTQHQDLAPITPTLKNLDLHNDIANCNNSRRSHKGKAHPPSRALNPLDPYELEGKPVSQLSTVSPPECEFEELSEARTKLSTALEKYTILFEAKMHLWVAALQEHKHLHLAYQRYDETPTARRAHLTSEALSLQLIETAQETLAKSPPAAPTKPEPVPYPAFIQLLEEEGLTWLLEHVNHLDTMDDYAVACTTDPRQKRCRVGRPRGKILKREQGDDLVKRLCCMHLGKVGFWLQVDGQGRDPWRCWPRNADESVDADVAAE
jgi:hypothetical protein